MCSKSVLNEITDKVVKAAKESLGDKLDKVILYGSYARGDFTDESDIDIMVIADVEVEELRSIEKELLDITWELGYEYDLIVALFLKDSETFYKFLPAEPFYQNIMRDGVLLSA
ncbi:MAG: nucleotidyltransferase domain-containing protein [Oscillospiraceae bacterium]|nr:nucleotidyltransferase domain-containing protein [Oscillospiraceae bacterium]